MSTAEVTGRIGRRRTALDHGRLPVEGLATLARREGWRPRPIYQAHRWFARRFGSQFRALLTAADLPPGADFWGAYHAGRDLSGTVVLDPFVGGCTSAFEAQRLGAEVIGVDVDAVACAITRFETRAASMPDPGAALRVLARDVGERVAPFYRTVTPEGDPRTVLHYFYVQVVGCRGCGREVEAHPHHQLAYEAEGTRQWAFCVGCREVRELPRGVGRLRCRACRRATDIPRGPVDYGRLTCPHCRAEERLIDVAARTGQPPRWKLFAVETLEPPVGKRMPMTRRRFRTATPDDLVVLEAARELARRQRPDGTPAWVPERPVPLDDRADDRLIAYGYRRYRELFNPRQLLHLSLLAEAIAALDGPVREALAIAFSDHLATNCMMAHYAFGWRRLAPLFSVRAYRHVTRPVEINPWLDDIGRGTFPNAVRQVRRAIMFARAPREPEVAGGFRPPVGLDRGASAAGPLREAKIVHGDSRRLSFLRDRSVDLVLTDPPYFDNIAYSELADFYLPWLQQFGLAAPDGGAVDALRANLATRGRDDDDSLRYAESLGACFREVGRVLRPGGRLVFTYRHSTAPAWEALASALACAGLKPMRVFPLLGDGQVGPHAHEGSSTWDAVFVMAGGC
jgi:adenine-specific DNA methylase